MRGDGYCRSCGASSPGQYIVWDWKEQPDLLALNPLLRRYGCKIEMPETGRDEFAARVVPLTETTPGTAGGE